MPDPTPAPLARLEAQTRLLLGPGPSVMEPSVLSALALPTIGHLDPAFLSVMDEVRAMLSCLIGATDGMVTPISGTGSAGMEAAVVNLIEPGDRAVIGVAGVFGGRMAEVARRAGAEVVTVEVEFGQRLEVEALRAAVAGKPTKLIGLVHAETSTGMLQPLEGLSDLAAETDSLLLVDAVTSLAGHPIDVGASGIDALYSGTQKCLSCPPGLAPLYLSERALAVLRGRKFPVQSWYLDLGLIESYWGAERAYHHTAPINMLYALHEALRLVHAEGLEARYERHARTARAAVAGLSELGLMPKVPAERRLNPLTSVAIPEGVDDAAVRGRLLHEWGIEIGGGLGPWKGAAWRIGLMGAGSRRANVESLTAALANALGRQDRAGAALSAIEAAYA